MDCPACTTDVPDGTAFCGACGAVVDATSAKTQSNAQTAAFSRGVSSSASSLDESRFLPGTMIAGRYRIIGLLGRGGMGEVYRADDLKLGQAVALKFLSASALGSDANRTRLINEARTAAGLQHPNIAVIYGLVGLGVFAALIGTIAAQRPHRRRRGRRHTTAADERS